MLPTGDSPTGHTSRPGRIALYGLTDQPKRVVAKGANNRPANTPTSASTTPSQVTPSVYGVAVVLGDPVRVHVGVESAILRVRHDLFAEQTSALGAALEVRAVRREVL